MKNKIEFTVNLTVDALSTSYGTIRGDDFEYNFINEKENLKISENIKDEDRAIMISISKAIRGVAQATELNRRLAILNRSDQED